MPRRVGPPAAPRPPTPQESSTGPLAPGPVKLLATCQRCGREGMEVKRTEHFGANVRETNFILDCTNEQCGSYRVRPDGTPLQQKAEDCQRLLRLLRASQNSTEHERPRAERLLEREKRKCSRILEDLSLPEPERKRARTELQNLAAEECKSKGRPMSQDAEGRWALYLQDQWQKQLAQWNVLSDYTRGLPAVWQHVEQHRRKWSHDHARFVTAPYKARAWETILKQWWDLLSELKTHAARAYAAHATGSFVGYVYH